MDERRRIRYVMDTDTVSAHQRSRPAIVARLAQLGPGAAATAAVTMYEQFRGRLAMVARARDDDSLRRAYEWLQATQRYFCDVIVLPFDTAAAVIYRQFASVRLRVGTQDLRIAAIALAHGATLVTSNRGDFEQVPGLRIEDWNVG